MSAARQTRRGGIEPEHTAGSPAKLWRRLVAAVVTSAAVVAAFAAPAGAATTTFTRETPTTILGMGNAIPYPSSIEVSGLTGEVTDVAVTLNQFSHERPHDFGMVLVAPGGEALALMDCITEQDASGLFVTLSDAGAAIPDVLSLDHGLWRPTNYCPTITDYPDPGPGTTYSNPPTLGSATFGSTFGGTDPNGAWNLFITDFVFGADGAIGSWSLSITTPDPAEPPPPAEPPGAGEPADTSPPETTITEGPKGKTKKKKATFDFTAIEPSSTEQAVAFRCKLDAAAFESCTSPKTYKVKKGKHTFQVQATAAGVTDPTPATHTWKRKKRKQNQQRSKG